MSSSTGAEPGFPWRHVSRNIERFGYTVEDCKAGLFTFPEFVHPDDRSEVARGVRGVAEGNAGSFNQDYRVITKDGSVRWVHSQVGPVRDDTGAVKAYRGTLTDVTERTEFERRTRRINRTLKTVSECNAALVRAGYEPELLSKITEILVEVGGYVLAWVAFPNDDADKTVHCVAGFGKEINFVDRLNLSWADQESGRAPVGTALRT